MISNYFRKVVIVINVSIYPNIFYRRYDDEMIICDTKAHNVFIVNDVAAEIIELIGSGQSTTTEGITDTLANEYDIDCDTVDEFLNELSICQIISILDYEEEVIFDTGSESYSNDYDNQVELEFQDKLAEKFQLYSALIELTYKCNLNCIHCYAINGGKETRLEMNTAQVLELLNQLYNNKVFRLILTGGELFTRKDIMTILRYAYEKKFLVDIFSNGLLLDDKIVEQVSECHIRSFQTSIYSHIPEKHDAITGQKGSFERTVATLKKFKNHGVSINIKAVLMESNYKDYYGLNELALKLGASLQCSFSIIPRNNGSRDNLSNRVKDMETMRQILSDNLKRMNRDTFFRERSSSEQICGMGKTGVSIDPYGNVYPCNLLKVNLGNVFTQDIKNIWNNSSELQKLRNLTIADLDNRCNGCDKINYCVFCPGSALAETGNLLTHYDEACFVAKAKKSIDFELEKEVKK